MGLRFFFYRWEQYTAAVLASLTRLWYHKENTAWKDGATQMEPKDYTVTRIEGEYAYLRADNEPAGEELFIAMALLPAEVDVGTRLHYEMFSYTVIE